MKKKTLFDSIDVPSPCDKSWDEMIGDDVSRFCKHCEKDIYNISTMTRQEAKKLLFQSKEKVCIRMEREADGKIKTLKKQLHQITRHVPLAAGVLTASMILSGGANAQETKVETSKITVTQTADKNSKPTISGTIKTIEEYVIPGVKVILRNVKDGSTRTTISDGEGLYEFKNVMPSVYTIETKDDTGFKDFIYPNLSIEDNKNMNLTITLVSNGKVELLGLDGINPGIKTSIPSPMDKNSKPTISGTITDSQGALLPGIKVILRNTKDNSIRTTVADKEGFYEFKDVESLNYDIEVVEKYPFKKFVYKNLVVTKEKNFDLTIVLELQSGVEVVGLVTTETPVKTETPPINTNVTYQELVQFPVSERMVLGLPNIPIRTKPKNKKVKNLSQISFTIFDSNGMVIPDAEVRLTNSKTKHTFTTKTNNKGFAYFSSLPRGKYEVKASMQGFRNGIISLIINEKIEPNIEMILEVGIWTGVVSINWSEIPTFNAIIQDDVENVKKSINAGFSVNTKDSSGKTALHFAAESGNLEIVRFLLGKGAKINAKDKFNRTPILMLDGDDEGESIKILKLLISKSADVNVQDKYESGRTLLMEVCDDENFEIAKILLEAGANPNLKDEDGETAIQKTKSEEIKKLLKKYGAKN